MKKRESWTNAPVVLHVWKMYTENPVHLSVTNTKSFGIPQYFSNDILSIMSGVAHVFQLVGAQAYKTTKIP